MSRMLAVPAKHYFYPRWKTKWRVAQLAEQLTLNPLRVSVLSFPEFVFNPLE